MAWGVFNRDFNFDYRPALAVSQFIKAGDRPQQVKREVLDAAVAAGAAKEVKRPAKKTA